MNKDEPKFVINLRAELMLSKMTHNFTLSRDELMILLRMHDGQTPAAQWREDGEQDPHGTGYDEHERANLAMGYLTDDELANAVYLHGDRSPSIADLLSGKALRPIVYLTAAKERIRWLSRALVKARAAAQAPTETQLDNFDVIIRDLARAHGMQHGPGDHWMFENHELFKFVYAVAKKYPLAEIEAQDKPAND